MNDRSQWRRTLWVMWLCQFTTMMAMAMVVPFLPFYLRVLAGHNPIDLALWSGFVLSGPFVMQIFLAPFWGRLGDRYGHKLMVIRALIGLVVSQCLIGLAATPMQLLLFRLLQGVLSGFVASALVLVSTVAPPEKTSYALGVLHSSSSAGTVIGPFVGGLLAEAIGFRLLFFIIAGVVSLMTLLVLTSVRTPIRSASQQRNAKSGRSLAEFLFKNKTLALLLLGIASVQAANGFSRPIFPLWIEQIISPSSNVTTITGLLFSLVGFMTLLSAPSWGAMSSRFGMTKALTVTIVGSAIFLLLHAFVNDVWTIAMVRIGLGAFFGGAIPLCFSWVSVRVDEEQRGGILGIATSFSMFGNTVGPILGGGIATVLPFQFTFICGAALCLVSLFFIPRNHARDRGSISQHQPAESISE